MAIGFLDSNDLIDTVKREAMIPINQNTFENSDFWAIANQEMRASIVPFLITFHQEYLVRDSDPITINANQNAYPIPYRAVGQKFREVFYKDINGQLRSMTRISPDDRPYYQQTNFQNRFIYFYLQGNEVVLVPDVGENPTGYLVFSYYLRPNELVDPVRVSTIISSSVDEMAGTTTFTVDQVPTTATATQNGQTITGFTTTTMLDILQYNPGHKTYVFDKIPTAVDSVNKSITFNSADLIMSNSTSASGGQYPAPIVPGDYIAFAGECKIPQVPSDLHDMLCQRVVTRILLALGDQQGYQASVQKLVDMENTGSSLINNRSEGEAQKINNLRGVLRSAKIRRRGWI